MAGKKLQFLRAVANEYREKCPELSRIMMMKYLEGQNALSLEDFRENFDWNLLNACEHCGTVFTDSNCTFRIKSKRKRKKNKKGYVKNDKIFDIMPKSCNFLQILCKFCGWKTRHRGAWNSRSNAGSLETHVDMSFQTPKLSQGTPKLSRKAMKSPGSGFQGQKNLSTQQSSGKKKRTKSRLRELLAKEKLETEEKITSPGLINFLSTIDIGC